MSKLHSSSLGRGQTGGWSKEVLGDLVNEAYGPTPSEAGLMWNPTNEY
jgi:hypothetical protein